MSESGHSQPGLYGIERRRRWKEPGSGGPQNLSGPGGRERDYIAPWERERRDASEETSTSVMQKTPIILSKPPAERSKQPPPPTAPAAPPAPAPLEKPIVLMKPREEGKGPVAVTGASTPEGTTPPPPAAPAPPKGEKEGQRPTQPVYQIQNRGMGTAAPAAMDPVVGQAKLLPPERMKHSIKLVDDQMNWCDSAIEYLLDQTDVLVVGVLGLQGTGKSMVMSLLSANTPEEDQRTYVFRAQSAEMKERGGNQTSGIDFFITQERIVFLDTQPILSPSILDHLINNDRKLPPEYNLPHTYVEMQSLQIAAFLFTVCHVVIVVQDWFTDLSLYRFLQTAEMVKPSTPSPSHESSSSSGSDEGTEYYPHLVFLQNKARREDFCPRKLQQMHLMIDQLMAHSHLRYKGTLSMLQCNVFPGLPPDFLDSEVNLFLVPFMDSEAESENPPRAGPGSSPLFSLLPGYRGHPSFQSLVSKLRSQVMSMARPQLSHTILTEKNWFHYAARIWDGVRKSSALAEYSRLLA
ncbi:nonsense-mediated mRNA decay factor SMG9 [Pan paniscus]|uniref:Nonsense-mediated mRNA decay factor SMG9 n=1 Tax=Pan paniscus TaxID=9597 RepID=A0A2R9AAK9_PANPA|nr:nonsense-mediated mRNA decay factor SMG9 [Pan paniscus]XP_054960020.1 nonsense-mediated mRNA decay factor SMG9 [Pan paniscus]XP_054960021.1 nonsense-mediated mRNA decay factor SMG9 [Pan paniscus]XP_054960022.1 nonsense-mediated mRNA decay factor SMG9 [Pan paniscus]XP_054960023.1 nonsense-mediated mRNA decay factor SMG9 [Pan paniscus]